MSPRIVVLGAGYAGLRAALDLARATRCGRLAADVVVVDRSPCHQVITLLHQVATELIPSRRACLRLDRLLPGTVRLIRADVEGIDPRAGVVATRGGRVGYDRLVVTLGSETTAPPIPGLERAFRLRWWADAVRLRDHLRGLFARAGRSRSRQERRGLLRLVVAGGGLTGCQLAGELAHWVGGLADEHGVPLADVHLVLLEAGPRLLPSLERRDGRRAADVLGRKAVDVRLATPLESVDNDRVAFGGQGYPCRTVVWCGGIRAPALLADGGLPAGDGGRVEVDRRLRATGFPEIAVAGDTVLGQPATAQAARRQGAYIATSLADELAGRRPAPYRPLDLGTLVSLGGLDAVGGLVGVPLEGAPASLAKEAIERSYFPSLGRLPPLDPPPPFGAAVDWLLQRDQRHSVQ